MALIDSVIITTTLHETSFRLKPLLDSCLPFIKKHELKVIVSCTSPTSKEVIAYLEENGFIVSVALKDKRVVTYLHALEVAINNIKDPDHHRILYVDFDRLLHWIHNYPQEFIKTLEQCSSYEFLHIGRNPRAFSSHPETQQHTERIVNQLGSKILGLSEIHDQISVCYSFTKELAEIILNMSYPTDMGFYSTWPILLWMNAKNKKYIEVDGQEWETPDRFQKEINEIGYDEWLKQFQSAHEWKFRIILLEDCILELLKYMK